MYFQSSPFYLLNCLGALQILSVFYFFSLGTMARAACRRRLVLAALGAALLWWPGARLGQDVSFAAPKKEQVPEKLMALSSLRTVLLCRLVLVLCVWKLKD